MLRENYLFSLSFGVSAVLASPAYAQVDGGLRSILPTAKEEVSDRKVSDAVGPQLLRKETPADDRGVPETQLTQSIRVGSVLIEATPSVDYAMFDSVIEPLLGQNLSNAELARLAQQIAEVARANGMVLARAFVPVQQVELGIVKIVLLTGAIDEVRIQGSDNRALRDLLNPLAGKTVMQGELERRLTLAGDIPQIFVQQTELLIEGERQILLVKVGQRKKTRGTLVVDNYGSDTIGPLRARVSVEGVALLDDSDFANFTIRSNPSDPEELVAASISYGIALNSAGTRAELAAASSKSEIDAGRFFVNRDARSRYASLAVSHPLHRSRKSNLSVEGQFEYLKIDQDALGVMLQSDTVVTLSVGLSSSLRLGNGRLRAGTQLRQGLGLFDATQSNDRFASRFDADGQFTAGRVWLNWSGKPTGNMTLRIAVSGQVAAQPLLSSEELGLGGAFVGRAFDFFERSGDQGVLAMAELGYEFIKPVSWLNRLQPYAFIDGGYVDNLRGGFGGGSLMSAGGGVRSDIGPLGLQLEAGIPIYSTGNGATSSAPKINFQIGLNL
jgi:hemolysin activation/secretion protein